MIFKLVQSGHSGHGSVLVVNHAVADLLFVVENAKMEQLELIVKEKETKREFATKRVVQLGRRGMNGTNVVSLAAAEANRGLENAEDEVNIVTVVQLLYIQ